MLWGGKLSELRFFRRWNRDLDRPFFPPYFKPSTVGRREWSQYVFYEIGEMGMLETAEEKGRYEGGEHSFRPWERR